MRSLRPCSDSSATPSFPSQPEGKIGLPRANPRGCSESGWEALRRHLAQPPQGRQEGLPGSPAAGETGLGALLAQVLSPCPPRGLGWPGSSSGLGRSPGEGPPRLPGGPCFRDGNSGRYSGVALSFLRNIWRGQSRTAARPHWEAPRGEGTREGSEPAGRPRVGTSLLPCPQLRAPSGSRFAVTCPGSPVAAAGSPGPT